MTAELKQGKKAANALHSLQGKQMKRVTVIGGLRRKLDKHNHQMHRLEAKMAAMERQAYRSATPDEQPAAVSPKMLRPARLIINPNSGLFAQQAESPEKLVALLRTHGIQAEVYLKTSSKEVRTWVREAVKKKEALVIAVGGDGTIEDVAVELVGSQTVLGILPTGTMNNLARDLGIPLDIAQACALLGVGITRQIDIGHVRASGKVKGSYFLEAAGLGLAVALPAGQNVKKHRWHKLPEDFRKLFDLGPTPIEIELENGETLKTQVQLVTVSNAPLFGINNLIAPEAKMDDGVFDLAVYDGMSDLDLAEYFRQTANGQRVSNPNVHFHRTRRVQIRSHAPMPETSGGTEHPAQLVLDIELIPRAIRIIVGEGAGLAWPVEAVTSVPPLTGPQTKPKNTPDNMPAQLTIGEDSLTPTFPPHQPEPAWLMLSKQGAQDDRNDSEIHQAVR